MLSNQADCLLPPVFQRHKVHNRALRSPPQRVLSHQDDTALLKAYIVEWRKFFTQCDILPKPFCQLEITLMGKQGSNKKSNVEDSIVRKVRKWGGRNGMGMREMITC